MKGRLVVVVWLMLVPVVLAAITTIPWDISEEAHPADTYHTFLESLRNELKDPNEKPHSISVMRKPTTSKMDNDNYLLVELQASTQKSIILSLDRSNLYLMGYSDIVIENKNKKCRHHVFKDQDAKCKEGDGVYKRCGLCDGVASAMCIDQPINYESRYESIVNNARVTSRKKIGLGFGKLNSWVELVYGSEINVVNEARFLLTAIQMVSEATRFSYIQNMVLAAAYQGVYNPDDRVLCYENKWSKASKLIKTTPAPTEQKPDFVIDIDCWVFSSVAEIQEHIALLCYYECKEDDTTTLLARAKAIIDDTQYNQVVATGSVPISLLAIGTGIYFTYRMLRK